MSDIKWPTTDAQQRLEPLSRPRAANACARTTLSIAIAALFLLSVLIAGCSDAAPTLVEAPTGAFPDRISGLGLYEDVARRTLAVGLVPYEPRFPLYSNGLDKQRVLSLPPGETIQQGPDGAFVFPVGTLLFKTFLAESDGVSQPVETRVLRLGDDGWEYAGYRWDDDGLDGARLSLDEAIAVRPMVDGEPVDHAIPSLFGCRQCHESNETFVIGLTPLQTAGSAALALQSTGLLDATLPGPEALDEDPVLAAALEYAAGNCTHCHNGLTGASRSFDLRPAAFVENLVNVPTTGINIEVGLRVTPGVPEESVLFRLLAGTTSRVMPPLGAETIDDDGVAVFRVWIDSLTPSPP